MCLLHTLTFYDCLCTKTQTIPCPSFWTAIEYGDNASLCATKAAKSETLAGACVNCYIKDYPLLVDEKFTNRTAAEALAAESAAESDGSMAEEGGMGLGGGALENSV